MTPTTSALERAPYTCPNGCAGFWLTAWERDEHVHDKHGGPATSGPLLALASASTTDIGDKL